MAATTTRLDNEMRKYLRGTAYSELKNAAIAIFASVPNLDFSVMASGFARAKHAILLLRHGTPYVDYGNDIDTVA